MTGLIEREKAANDEFFGFAYYWRDDEKNTVDFIVRELKKTKPTIKEFVAELLHFVEYEVIEPEDATAILMEMFAATASGWTE